MHYPSPLQDSLKICTDMTRLPENRPALDALTLGRALMALALAGHWLKSLRYLHRVSVCRAVLGGLSHALWSLFVLGLLLVVVMASLAQGLVLTLGFSSSSFRCTHLAASLCAMTLEAAPAMMLESALRQQHHIASHRP